MPMKVERLKVNFRTMEEFKKFKEYGAQELSMLEDLQAKMVEDAIQSPFYGIYLEDKLIARMSLYKRDAKFDQYFDPPQDYLELWKLEVLPDYRHKGHGKTMVDYAKSFGMPIKTNSRLNSREFWERMDFQPVKYDMDRDRGENPMVWFPPGVSEQQTSD